MRKNSQFRWIEEAQARKVADFAALQRAIGEPAITVTYRQPGSTWLDRFRLLRSRSRSRAAASLSSPDRSADRVTT